MNDVEKALEAATRAMIKTRITGVYPTTSEEASTAVICAFLEAMPQAYDTPGGRGSLLVFARNYRVSEILAAVKEYVP